MQSFISHIQTLVQDAIVWKAQQLYKPSGTPDDKQKGIDAIAAMLGLISSDFKREEYITIITAQLKIKKSHLNNALKQHEEFTEDAAHKEATVHKLPAWADKDRVYNYALDWRENAGPHTGFYFSQNGNQLVQLTNFVIKPLFHLKDMSGNTRRLAMVHSSFKEDQLIELPSKSLISLDQFEVTFMDMGNYHTMEGFGKPHLKRMFRALGNQFPFATEFKFLGWQRQGFWAFCNAVFYKNELLKFDDIGMVKIGNDHYHSPAASSLHSSKFKDEDGKEFSEDDIYANDKALTYRESQVTYEYWCQHMVKMHQDAALPLIAYSIVTVFKDIVISYEKCPLLYGYGLVQSGKSTWAEALYYLFNDISTTPFNLNQGTIFAFFNRLERFRNVNQLFNEFDEDTISEDFYRAFKAFYDKEGRDKGSGIKGKVQTQEINCTVTIVGQTLTTKDGASVLIRSIPVKFLDKGERTDEEKKNYDTWFAWVQKGMNGCIVDVLAHRKHFKANFFTVFNDELKKLKDSIKDDGDIFKERIAKNYCIILTAAKVMMDVLQLGFTYQHMFAYCKKNIVDLSRMISEVDNLATFWQTVLFLYEKGDVQEAYDFKLVDETAFVKKLGKEEMTINFDKPTKILYVRLVKVYPLYAQSFRLTSGGKPINQRTLETYFESNKSFLGRADNISFKAPNNKRTNTSCFAFDYAKMGITLERLDEYAVDSRKEISGTYNIGNKMQIHNIGGVEMMVFDAYQYVSQPVKDGPQKSVRQYTKCSSKQVHLSDALKPDTRVKLVGLGEEKVGDKYTTRTLDVQTIHLLNIEGNEIVNEGDEPF